MPKFFVTVPALPGKYFECEAKDPLFAISAALNLTVWSGDEWLAFQERTAELYSDPNCPFPPAQRIDWSGKPY